MNYDQVVKRLAPCGLDCSRCADYESGEIRELSLKLAQLLAGYGRVAKMKEDKNPIFSSYPQFEEILSSFSRASCGGCRSGALKCPIECHAKTCFKEKGVDFCFQCDEYPCDKQFTGGLRERWKTINNRMKEIGAVEYYQEQARQPRY